MLHDMLKLFNLEKRKQKSVEETSPSNESSIPPTIADRPLPTPTPTGPSIASGLMVRNFY